MISSNEIVTLINNLGLDPKAEEIDLKDLRYGKIIIMTDADVDGSHIRTLLLTFFNNKPFNELIEKGHLYLAQPPLFKVTKGSKSIYIKNEKDLEKYILKSKENGAKNIRFVCLLAAPEGIKYFNKVHPDVQIFTAAIDIFFCPVIFL